MKADSKMFGKPQNNYMTISNLRLFNVVSQIELNLCEGQYTKEHLSNAIKSCLELITLPVHKGRMNFKLRGYSPHAGNL